MILTSGERVISRVVDCRSLIKPLQNCFGFSRNSIAVNFCTVNLAQKLGYNGYGKRRSVIYSRFSVSQTVI